MRETTVACGLLAPREMVLKIVVSALLGGCIFRLTKASPVLLSRPKECKIRDCESIVLETAAEGVPRSDAVKSRPCGFLGIFAELVVSVRSDLVLI